ncbi:MAG: hypothetical protein DWH84_03725 [Planctomycetota bacterium]|nr:MAG: hypothetical protein DWH84_03725 [Planctomycetota bacterium]
MRLRVGGGGGYWVLGIGHWALGIGHWALGIGPSLPFPNDVLHLFDKNSLELSKLHIRSSKASLRCPTSLRWA